MSCHSQRISQPTGSAPRYANCPRTARPTSLCRRDADVATERDHHGSAESELRALRMGLSITSHCGSCTVESVIALDRVRQAAVRPAVLIWALLLAGFIKGFIGLGLPTTATGPLTVVMTPGQAALLVVPKAATNIWQALTGKHLHPLRRRFCPMLPGIGIGSTPGA